MRSASSEFCAHQESAESEVINAHMDSKSLKARNSASW